MKRNLPFIISASAVSFFGLSALAQDSPNSQKVGPDYSRHESQGHHQRANRLNGAAKGSDVIGMAGAVTPLDQGSSKTDLATTAQIRKEIMAGKNMSVNAQNVKIITNNGQVTLRGPVNSEAERQRVGTIADKIARAENVDNQLEVKLTTSNN